jgi:hypothetical protein
VQALYLSSIEEAGERREKWPKLSKCTPSSETTRKSNERSKKKKLFLLLECNQILIQSNYYPTSVSLLACSLLYLD